MAVISILREHFRVGDRAPRSGSYRVIHKGHRKSHRVLVLRGDEFPPCRFCKDEAVFELAESAEYIAHDIDFSGLLFRARS